MPADQILINPLCRQPGLDRRFNDLLQRHTQVLPPRCPGVQNGPF
jgi:hypothetical protein